MATSALPSFRQTFGDQAMDPPPNNSLPPIHRRAKSPSEIAGRKRVRTEEDPPDSSARVKEEDRDDSAPAEASSSKKRRVALPLNTNVRAGSEQSTTTPISPVVMGFGYTVMRDNPTAIDQVRSSITAKQKQKALIEQRRGSTAAPPEEVPAQPKRPSPRARPPTPPALPPTQPVLSNSLPAPPISFARRRAEQLGGNRKPADIIISPREAHTKEQFAPAIQSAPPIPQGGGQASYYSRHPMTIPRLPPVMGGAPGERKVAGLVPPTPTRLGMQRHHSSNAIPSISHPQVPPAGSNATRSPPGPSVPIASTLVPPTPTSLQHPGYSGDKSAFLAPFEVFYDALNDSKQLKAWLGEQLQKSNALMQHLTQQQEKLNETVEMLVERRMAPMRAEMAGLYRRVDELEDALRVATGRRKSVDSGSVPLSKGKKPLRNGNLAADYTFPPRGPAPPPPRRVPSPGYDSESQTGSPAPFDARRMSVSATRLDPPRTSFETSSQRGTLNTPPQGLRDNLSRSPSHVHAAIPKGGAAAAERPGVPPRVSSSVKSTGSQPGSSRASPAPDES
ncbi:hypothetical protein MKEN_00893800 [Mycena kentingensis (nom. inval.)]|nr:hypothetical protein MKEN_00893800 [Mycena kentingensis (nom. inval.)]